MINLIQNSRKSPLSITLSSYQSVREATVSGPVSLTVREPIYKTVSEAVHEIQ